MEKSGVVRLARVLKVLVTIVFVCNLAVLFLVPGVTYLGFDGVVKLAAYEWSELRGNLIAGIAFVWRQECTAVLTLFLLFCGVCTAVTLWQARGVLETIVREDTFTMPNARRLKRAAVCCLLISAAALARTVWGLFYYRSMAPVFTYNTVFIPIFLMGGLLCMVMSALFRQAAELKEENDLTI